MHLIHSRAVFVPTNLIASPIDSIQSIDPTDTSTSIATTNLPYYSSLRCPLLTTEEEVEAGETGTTEVLAPGTEPTEEPTGIKMMTIPTRESGLILLKRTAIPPLQLAK